MKKEDFFELLGELDDDIVRDAKSTTNKNKLPAWVKWGTIAACLALIAVLAVPRAASAPKGMYKIGTVWETDQFAFCVTSAAFCDKYETEVGDIITPDEGCRFIAVEYSAAYAQDMTLSECVLEKGDVYSEPHTAYMGPIKLTSNTAEDGNDYVLLFSIPLSESDADTPSQNSYSLTVELGTGERTYSQDFSLVE